jgi:hypothetical protein
MTYESMVAFAESAFGVAARRTFASTNRPYFATDYFTSRATSKLWAEQNWHRFFLMIGFDQLIHQATLAATLWIMVTQ